MTCRKIEDWLKDKNKKEIRNDVSGDLNHRMLV